jgi:hypothetical protein
MNIKVLTPSYISLLTLLINKPLLKLIIGKFRVVSEHPIIHLDIV